MPRRWLEEVAGTTSHDEMPASSSSLSTWAIVAGRIKTEKGSWRDPASFGDSEAIAACNVV
jgi:hypothetical protein